MDEDAESLEDEYEYEYDDVETETFLVDLDLSSLNHVSKARATGAPQPNKSLNRKKTNTGPQTSDLDENLAGLTDQQAEKNPIPDHTQQTPHDASPEDGEPNVARPSTVQVLDLHTSNPIISYQDQIYSCTWSDMIGTNMFFAPPGIADYFQALHTTEDFDLLGMSRIKLVGQRASVRKTTLKRSQPEDHPDRPSKGVEGRENTGDRTSDGSFHTNPKVNAQTKKQASFLETLMEVKAKRGEQDTVRTYVDEKIASGEPYRLSESLRGEVDDLNRRVVRGDMEALARLQKIYSQLDDQTTEPT